MVQKKHKFNYVQLHKINKISSYTTNYMQRKKIKKQIHKKKCKRIESILTSVSKSCTAYLLIGERTGSIKIMNNNKYKNHSRKKGIERSCCS